MQVGKVIYQNFLWRGLFYFSTFLLNILIARHFEASLSGSIYFLLNIYTLLHLLLSMSMESGIMYYGSKEIINPKRLLHISIIWTIIAACILFFFFSVFNFSAFHGIEKEFLLISSLTFICGTLLFNYAASLFYVKRNFMIPNLISVIINLILILLVPGNFVAIGGVNNDNYFYIYFIAFVVQGVITAFAYQLTQPKKQPDEITFRQVSQLFKYSLLAWSGNIAFFFLYRIDYWFVNKYCTAEELGNYIQVSKLGQLFFLIPSIMAGAVFTLTASKDSHAKAEWIALLSRLILFVYTVICFILLLIGNWLFPLVFGETFHLMNNAFRFVVPGILALSTLYTLTAFNSGNNKLWVNMSGCLLALAIVLIGNILFVPRYGINAAAAVSSIGYIVYQVFLFINFEKDYKVPIRHFFSFSFKDFNTVRDLMMNKSTNEL